MPMALSLTLSKAALALSSAAISMARVSDPEGVKGIYVRMGGVSVVREVLDELNVALSGLTVTALVGARTCRLAGLSGSLVGALFFALEEHANLGDSQLIEGVVADVAVPLIVQCRDEFGLIS
jgi:hypothetical protein